MVYPLIILGGGLSGLAAGIRFARFGQKVLILERHTIAGGLNSYYRRRGQILETGLHAMTNFAPSQLKGAPLNRLFRQLKLKRKQFVTHQQLHSKIIFPEHSLTFSNNFSLLTQEIEQVFPHQITAFLNLVEEIRTYDAFNSSLPRISARKRMSNFLSDQTLQDMILCPLMIYGNSEEHDMDFGQFVIMFRSIFLEGFFRPEGTMRDFITQMINHFQALGGEIHYRSEVRTLRTQDDLVQSVQLQDGTVLEAENIISTIGAHGTKNLLEDALTCDETEIIGNMSFVENIFFCRSDLKLGENENSTILFYNSLPQYSYCKPEKAVNVNTGVICFPDHFEGIDKGAYHQVRVTHPANYDLWDVANKNQDCEKERTKEYLCLKKKWQDRSLEVVADLIGDIRKYIVWSDSFTPLTVEKFTKKVQGAIYGSPRKFKDGQTNYKNLFLAGTDQGFLGIVGSMLSGITIVNKKILLNS